MQTSTTPLDAPFAALGLDAELAAAVQALGYEEPTPIQREAIPLLLAGKDLLGQAATGTGKTAAFALPLIALHGRSAAARRRPRVLVLVPTRELAVQVAEAVERYGHGLGVRVAAIYGGSSFPEQVRALDRGANVVVATPGRTVDHLTRGTLSFDDLKMVVLDEADEMLDMGFADDLEAILSKAPAERQTALFSATMAPRIAALAERHLRSPQRVSIARETRAPGEAPRVRQLACTVQRHLKLAALGRLLEFEDPSAAIVFCKTRGAVDEITQALQGRGHAAEALHGGLGQDQRERVLARFREGRQTLLVATDVAARGLDIDHLSHVINYDLPMDPDVYVHRIGRTGRAGRLGVALNLVEPREQRFLRGYEVRTGARMEPIQVPGLAAIEARRMARTREALEAELAMPVPEELAALVAELAETADPKALAIAALRMAHRARYGEAKACTVPDQAFSTRQADARGERGLRRGRPERDDNRFERPAARSTERNEALRRQRQAAPSAAGELTFAAPDSAAQAFGAPVTLAGQAPDGPALRTPRSAARLYVGAGRDWSLKPQDLIRAITEGTGLPKRVVGPIHIAERFSLLEVSAGHADQILDALCRARVGGRALRARYDRETT